MQQIEDQIGEAKSEIGDCRVDEVVSVAQHGALAGNHPNHCAFEDSTGHRYHDLMYHVGKGLGNSEVGELKDHDGIDEEARVSVHEDLVDDGSDRCW